VNILFNFEEELVKYGLSSESYELCLNDISNKVTGKNDMDWEEIIDKYNLPIVKDTLRKASSQSIFGNVFVSEYFKNKSLSENVTDIEKAQNTYRSESSINKDGTYTSDKLIAIKEDDLKNPISLLKAHGFDMKDWELVSARNNIWNVYSKQDGIQELYSSKIVVKPRSNISLEEIHDFYECLIKEYTSPIIKKHEKRDGFLAEIPIMDLHLGKFSTSDIVADEYNTNIARNCFNKVIDECIYRLRNVSVEKIIFPVGQDFFHYDTVGTTTTGGTPQDSDRKHQTLFKDGVTLLIDGISKLSSELKAPIEVFCVPGNHDFMTSYHAVMPLWCYFHNNENVTVDLSTFPRKYVEFNGAGIMVTNTWYLYNQAWYYLGPDGAMCTSQLVANSVKIYAVNADGKMVTGEILLSTLSDGALVYKGLVNQ
jgi:hypothetical protein